MCSSVIHVLHFHGIEKDTMDIWVNGEKMETAVSITHKTVWLLFQYATFC